MTEPPACLLADLRCLQDRYGPSLVAETIARLGHDGRLQPAASSDDPSEHLS